MDIRVEGHDVAEGLHVQDEGGLTVRCHDLEAGFQRKGDQSAELSEIAAPVAEEGPNELRQREHVLAMRQRGKQVLLQPLAVGQSLTDPPICNLIFFQPSQGKTGPSDLHILNAN